MVHESKTHTAFTEKQKKMLNKQSRSCAEETEGPTEPHLVEVMVLVRFQQVEGFPLLITCSGQKVIKHMVVPVHRENLGINKTTKQYSAQCKFASLHLIETLEIIFVYEMK